MATHVPKNERVRRLECVDLRCPHRRRRAVSMAQQHGGSGAMNLVVDIDARTVQISHGCTCQRFEKLSGSPGRSQSNATSSPIDESVANAVVRLAPPKQMLVVSGSANEMKRGAPPVGDNTEMPPLIRVATQTLPAESTANES